MNKKKITIIGGGNIGLSIAEGLIKSGASSKQLLTVTKRSAKVGKELGSLKIAVTSNNIAGIRDADIVILAVQPKQLLGVLEEINATLSVKKRIVISVVSGVSMDEIQTVIGTRISLFRAMPNTAISIQASMTCIAKKVGSKSDEKIVNRLFNSLGEVAEIEEELMASATVLAACGIAFAMRFIRAASQGGIEIGFDAEIAQQIAAQTLNGATALLLSSGKHPEREIDKVTTPQGCTIAGLNEMEHQGFSSALIKGLTTSHKKINGIAH
ncbi:MAG: pyrroline-5-carboxylate reductase [Flavobacteriales bacterium]|nr:pyrroline-5-carboxylate reductase [Flavobacteriales bacterium]PCH89455.1 MAG: pyrroline-5-carboxylate reductase [Flavobacteriales bacterium]